MNPRLLPRVITTAGAARLGITYDQIRTELARERWQRLAAGVFLTRPDDPTRPDWIHAGLAVCDDRGVLSGWDAVRVLGIGPVTPPTAEVLLLVPGGRNRTVGGVHLRPSSRPLRVRELGVHPELTDVRIADPSRAVADTALTMVSARAVRAMVTASIQRRLCTAAQLVEQYETSPRNGSAALRVALADALAGAQSVAEADAVRLLRRRRVPPFEVNGPIRDASGRVVAIADVLWRQLRAVLEVDSREYHFGEADWKATMRRHNALERLGFTVAHYAPSDIRERGSAWADEVAAWLQQRRLEIA